MNTQTQKMDAISVTLEDQALQAVLSKDRSVFRLPYHTDCQLLTSRQLLFINNVDIISMIVTVITTRPLTLKLCQLIA